MIPLKLLIIEDIESDAALLVRHLEKTGYLVTWQRVEDETNLRKALAAEEWNMILADYRLPEFDAHSALVVLQESGLDIPFMVVSGAIGEETAVQLMRAGACDYLMKGNLARLGPAVKRELTEAKVRRERARTYRALQESEANLRRSQEIARIGHWVYTPQTGEILWSDEIYRIFALDPSTMPGSLEAAWSQRVYPDDTQRVMKFVEIMLTTGRLQSDEFRILRSDGTIRYLAVTADQPVLDNHDNIIQFSGVVQDITERKLVELALLEKMEESQKRARELEVIATVSSGMRSAQTRPELIAVVLENVVSLLKAQFATLAFLIGDSFIFDSAAGGRRQWHRQELPAHESILMEVLKSGTQLTLTIPSRDLPNWVGEQLFPESKLMVYPLVSSKNSIGVILIGLECAGDFDSEQLNLLGALASMAGNAINRMLAVEAMERMIERREMELKLIYQVSSAASKFFESPLALQQALAYALHAVQAETGGIFLQNESTEEQHGWVAVQGPGLDRPEHIEHAFPLQMIEAAVNSKRYQVLPELHEIASHEGSFCTMVPGIVIAMPMCSQERVVGVLAVCKSNTEYKDEEELTLLSFIADHLALVLENTRLHRLAEKSAVLEERSRLARDLHDSVTQILYSANLHSVGAQRYLEQGNLEKTHTLLEQIGQLIEQALKDMRLMVYELRAIELAKYNGLVGALQSRLDAVERRAGIQVIFEDGGLRGLSEDVEENIYRIAVEALNNSIKHAQATRLWIKIEQDDVQIKLIIQDNGRGFILYQNTNQGGIGLDTMRERAEGLGGQLKVESAPGKGTTIYLKVPVKKE